MDFGRFADRGPEAETVLIRHHGRLAFAVLSEHPVENRIPLVPRKIDVDIGRIFPAGIEKPLEEQMMFERVDMRDLEAVGHDRSGHRPSTARTRRLTDDFLHHEKVMGETFLPDDGQLLFDSFANFARQAAIPSESSFVGFLFQKSKGILILHPAEGRENGVAETPIAMAGFGDADSVLQRLGNVGELPGHAGAGHQPLCGCGAHVVRQP